MTGQTIITDARYQHDATRQHRGLRSTACRTPTRPRLVATGVYRGDRTLFRTAVLADPPHGSESRRHRRPASEHIHEGMDIARQLPRRRRLSTWLYKIAINESLSFLEKERKRQNLSIDDDASAVTRTIEAERMGQTADELKMKLQQGHSHTARETALSVQHEILRRHEIRGYVEDPRHIGRRCSMTSYHLAVKK